MKKLLFVVLVLIATNCFADTFKVPFRCYKKELIEEFAKVGIILDEDNPDAHGFIENRGAEYYIHTYDKPDNAQLFVDIPVKVMQNKRDGI